MTARLVGWVRARGRVDVAVGDAIRIGATADNDVVVPVDGVSRSHARIVRQADGYCLEDANSRNGTWVNGERVGTRTLRHLDVITLGRYADVVFVDSKRAGGSAWADGISVRLDWIAGPNSGRRLELPRGESLVGRAASCQVVVDDPGVSRAHARFIVTGSTVTLEDLGSINGTFVDGKRINTPMALASESVIGFAEPGGCRVVIEGTPDLDESSAVSYVATAPPDMEWRTRIVWNDNDDDADDEPVDIRPVAIPPDRGAAVRAPSRPAPARPAISAERARVSGDATQAPAPVTQLTPDPVAQPAFEPTVISEPSTAQTVLSTPALAAPAFGANDDGMPRTQADQPGKAPVVPPEFAPGGSELPAETVLGFREVGPPPRLQTSASIRSSPPSPPPPARVPSPERPAVPSAEPRPRRGVIQAVTLTGDSGEFVVTKGTATIGRSSAATIRIDSQDVSRIHAALVVTDDMVTVEDRGSANGTAVNGAIISGRRPLMQGDRLSFADFEFRVDFKQSDDTE